MEQQHSNQIKLDQFKIDNEIIKSSLSQEVN